VRRGDHVRGMKLAELIAVAGAGTWLLAACSSSGSGRSTGGSSGTAPASTVSAATPARGSSSAAPISGTALASKMAGAAASLGSAHVVLTTTAAGQSVTAQGSERFASGKFPTSMKVVYDKFNEPVSIAAPPADQKPSRSRCTCRTGSSARR
jgi:hypothetical protein